MTDRCQDCGALLVTDNCRDVYHCVGCLRTISGMQLAGGRPKIIVVSHGES